MWRHTFIVNSNLKEATIEIIIATNLPLSILWFEFPFVAFISDELFWLIIIESVGIGFSLADFIKTCCICFEAGAWSRTITVSSVSCSPDVIDDFSSLNLSTIPLHQLEINKYLLATLACTVSLGHVVAFYEWLHVFYSVVISSVQIAERKWGYDYCPM